LAGIPRRGGSAVRAAGEVGLLVSVVAGLIVAAGATPALAGVTPQTGPSGALAIAQAIAAPSTTITGASFVAVPPGTPDGTSTMPMGEFPTRGSSFGILTTGNVNSVPNTSTFVSTDLGGGSVRGNTDFDVTVLKVDLAAQPGANCLTFDFKFLSEEYPGFVNTSLQRRLHRGAGYLHVDHVGDRRSARRMTFSSTVPTTSSASTRPGSAACRRPTAPEPPSTGPSRTTTTSSAGRQRRRCHGLLHAATQVAPGAHFRLLFDLRPGDHRLDSATFLDNLTVGFVANPSANCVPGATPVNYRLSLSPVSPDNPLGTPQAVAARLTDWERHTTFRRAGHLHGHRGELDHRRRHHGHQRERHLPPTRAPALGSDTITACYEPSGPPCAALDSATTTWVKASPSISTTAASPVPAGGNASTPPRSPAAGTRRAA